MWRVIPPKEALRWRGQKFPTPVGDIFSTNITPDKTHGIGNYSYEDFEKAVRKGIAKDGHPLYPAMPYPSYAKLSDEDVQALYRYFMHDVAPSAVANKENNIPWLLSPAGRFISGTGCLLTPLRRHLRVIPLRAAPI